MCFLGFSAWGLTVVVGSEIDFVLLCFSIWAASSTFWEGMTQSEEVVKGSLFAGVLPFSQAIVSASCLAGTFRNGMQGEFGIHDGVFASVALLDWLGGDFMEPLASYCVTTATEGLQQPAAAACLCCV